MAEKVTGWDLWSTLQKARQEAEYYRSIPPVACPFDGELLREGPPSEPGVLYCPWGNFQYPRDYDADTMAGM